VKHGPSHAGKLPAWERLVFALVFVMMAAFVVVVTAAVARSGPPRAAGRQKPPARAARAGESATGRVQQAEASGPGPAGRLSRASLDRKLAHALRTVIAADPGHLAVGVIDSASGAEAVYGSHRFFHTASIVKADILATLLLQNQHAGTSVSDQEAGLAVPMIENSDDDAATDLWQQIGTGSALAAANVQLGLSRTVPGPTGYWGLTSTTVVDQLRLLTDLTSRKSPLTTASKDYELGLMENVQQSQQWGVSAAASPHTSYAVKDGWLPDPSLWVINSIGVVLHNGQQLLIAVLSNDQPTEAVGIATVSAAATAAARVITAAR
jgi:hypothetical protein